MNFVQEQLNIIDKRRANCFQTTGERLASALAGAKGY